MNLEKSKGGRGVSEKLRNEAILNLRKIDRKYYTPYKLGKIFQRDRKTISGILQNMEGGVIHS